MAGIGRRVVTVVFADLVGFAALSERLDAEDVAHIQDVFFASAEAVLTDHGGVVEKYIGDAVMATFGVAVASDDDAVRAVRAATALESSVRRTEAPLGLAPGTLELRVGVNTGEVVVSRTPGGWRVTGDVVNTAARLQVAAAPGEVLLGPETAFGVAHAFALESAGEVALRGKSAPVAVWRPAGARAVARRGLAALGLHAPMLGRTHVLDDLLGRLTSSAAPAPPRADGGGAGRRAVLLVAPPGVGKSRLAEELCLRAASAGHATLVARPTGRAGGYGAVTQLLREALAVAGVGLTAKPDAPADGDRTADGDRAADGARAADRDRMPDPAPQADAGARAYGPRRADGGVAAWLEREGFAPAHARSIAAHVSDLLDGRPLAAEPADLFASWTAALDAIPGPAPLWVVEDIHLAGADLRAFLAHALARPARGLVVLTARPDAALTEAGPLASVHVLHLPPLGADETESLVGSLVGPGTVPPGYVAGIVGVSGGNPLFVEELLRSWILGGVLTGGDGGWTFGGGTEPALPTTVHAIYQAQLDRLAPGHRAVIEGGSVPGNTFPSAALPALGVEDATVALDALTRAGLLAGPHGRGAHEESYTYRHALLRDTAYASLARGRRAELHARFAAWARERAADELVGLHLALALEALPGTATELDGRARQEVARDAASWLERAAVAHLVPAPQRAAELLGRALDVHPGALAADRVRRTLARAEALRRAGRLEDALTAFRDGGALAREPAVTAEGDGVGGADGGLATHVLGAEDGSSAEHLRDAALGYENALFASRLPRDVWGDDGLALLDAALELHPEPGEDRVTVADPAPERRTQLARGRVRLLAARGRALVYSGRRAEGLEAGAAAVRLSETAGDAAAAAEAWLALRAGLAGPEHLAERREGLRRAVDAADLTADLELQLEAARLQLVDALEDGDLAAAGAAQQRASGLAAALGRPLYLWYPPMWEAMRALLAGRFAAARGLIEAFGAQGRRSHYRDVELVRAIQMLELHLMTGDAPLAVDLVAGFAETDPDRWCFAEAVVRARDGDLAAARRCLERYARAGFANVVQDLGRSTTLAFSPRRPPSSGRRRSVSGSPSCWRRGRATSSSSAPAPSPSAPSTTSSVSRGGAPGTSTVRSPTCAPPSASTTPSGPRAGRRGRGRSSAARCARRADRGPRPCSSEPEPRPPTMGWSRS